MEINRIQDLIPYHKSLVDLWEQEGFQPVRLFLKAMREEALIGFRTLELKEPAETVKTRTAVLRTQYNLANLLLELPKAIKDAEALQEMQEQQKMKFKDAQEGGTI